MGSLLAKVLFEVVVCQLEGLFGRVRPEVPVHAAMHRLAVLVRPYKVGSKSVICYEQAWHSIYFVKFLNYNILFCCHTS